MSKHIGRLVDDGIRKCAAGDHELATLPICSAIDATARIRYPRYRKASKKRFKKFLEDNQDVILFVGTHGMIRAELGAIVRFCPWGDIQDIFYDLVRCGAVHEGCEFPVTFDCPGIRTGGPKLGLSPMFLIGLLLSVVGSPINKDQSLTKDYCVDLSYGAKNRIRVNLFWGQKAELLTALGWNSPTITAAPAAPPSTAPASGRTRSDGPRAASAT